MLTVQILMALAAGGWSAGEPATSRVVATDAIQPQVAIDGGRVYLVCIHQGNIAVAVSTDEGANFSAPVVAIDVKGRALGGRQRGPRIGVAAGSIVVTAPVTFDDAEYQKRYPTAELYLVRSSDSGATWSPPVRVNQAAKTAPEALHWMVVSADGTAHVAWLDIQKRRRGQDLFYARADAKGVGPSRMIAENVCECCAPGLAVDAAGNPIVAYREGGDKPSRELFYLRSQDRGGSFDRPVRINRVNTLEDT